MDSEKEASNGVTKREEEFGEMTLLLNEQKHSFSNIDHQLRTSGIRDSFQGATLSEILGTVEGVTNKNC